MLTPSRQPIRSSSSGTGSGDHDVAGDDHERSAAARATCPAQAFIASTTRSAVTRPQRCANDASGVERSSATIGERSKTVDAPLAAPRASSHGQAAPAGPSPMSPRTRRRCAPASRCARAAPRLDRDERLLAMARDRRDGASHAPSCDRSSRSTASRRADSGRRSRAARRNCRSRRRVARRAREPERLGAPADLLERAEVVPEAHARSRRCGRSLRRRRCPPRR